MGLKVIGAGFGRTGTASMKQALNHLGIGPCYHMHEVLPYPERVALWRRAAAGERPDWDAVFSGFDATVDRPAAYFWRELADFYPDAKILLTLRDAESRYASMEKTIFKFLRETDDAELVGVYLVKTRVFGGDMSRDHAIDIFNANTAAVQAAFPPGRLLTYMIGDGWEPLCAFVGCPVPDAPFPHTNRPGEFDRKMEEFRQAQEGNPG